MSTQQPAMLPAGRPPAVIGVLLGCLPVVVAVVAAFGIVHCRIGPMSYGYCSGSEQGTVLTIGVIALGSWVLELLATITCFVLRRFRRVGAGLLVMSILFVPLSVLALYAEAFFIIGHQ